MTTTPPDAPVGPPPTDQGPRATREEIRDLGRLRRTVGPDRKLAGVAGGLARHLDIDPVILRVTLVVLVFFGGAGLVLYGACWLLVPEDGDEDTPLGLDDRSRTVALVVVGLISFFLLLGDSVGQWDFPWPLVVIAVIAMIVLTQLDRSRGNRPRPTAPPVPHAPVPGTGTFAPVVPVVPGAPTGTWVTPDQGRPATWVPPTSRSPRRRGPILFWFTMALAALGVGTLGIVDLAGLAVADSAYPAVVVTTCGVMLLVGAFYGRAGGLILVGLLAAAVMGVATITSSVDGGDITRRPVVAADVDRHLRTSAGEIVVDLTAVQDPEALDGRTLTLDDDFGRIEVILPVGVSARIDAEVSGAGHIDLFGDERGGFGLESTLRHSAGPDTPELTIVADVSFGEIQVHTTSTDTEGAPR